MFLGLPAQRVQIPYYEGIRSKSPCMDLGTNSFIIRYLVGILLVQLYACSQATCRQDTAPGENATTEDELLIRVLWIYEL